MLKKTTKALLLLFLLLTAAMLLVLKKYPASKASDILVNKWAKTRDFIVSRYHNMRNPIAFDALKLEVPGLDRPTTLQFGPDGALYVASLHGRIFRLEIARNEKGAYHINKLDSIDLVARIPNHDDDGLLNPGVSGRQVTGLLASGTHDRPKLYVSSCDPRMTGDWDNASKSPDGDLNLDTNSGIISELEWDGTQWSRTDLVRGLPRSEENHAPNGLAMDPAGKYLYLALGGNTNAGGPSKYFGYLSEYALSAGILRIDLQLIRKMPVIGADSNRHVFDLPTLDDPARENIVTSTVVEDRGDPFGGNDGLNQARWNPDGPVTLAAAGFRNPYDILIPDAHPDKIYTIDNGADEGIGGFPRHMGTPSVSNEFDSSEAGNKKGGMLDKYVLNRNTLHAIPLQSSAQLYYGGHPVPIRANPSGAGWYWRDSIVHFSAKPTNDWPPMPLSAADIRQGDFTVIGASNPGIATFDYSTNGLAEYRSAAYFKGEMKGDIIAASFDGSIYRTKLRSSGDQVSFRQVIAKGFSLIPLDLVCQGDLDPFPGTIWVADFGANCLHILTPREATQKWIRQGSSDGSQPEARHESSFVEAAGRFYLIGGRGSKHMNVFDPFTRTWTRGPLLPDSMEMNHSQAVSMGGRIYMSCGLQGPFPEESTVSDLLIFDPGSSTWQVKKGLVPSDRRRGSSGAVAIGGKIYFVGGTTNGHARGSVPWTDVYDTLTGVWKRLKDAPHARDHFQASVVDGKIYAIGGRRSNQAEGRTFEDVEPSVDVYDIAGDRWTTLPPASNIPTPRGGVATVVIGGRIVVIGGESTQPMAHDQAEVFDTRSGTWSAFTKLSSGRHGTQAIVWNNTIIIVAGCGQQGGSPELNSMELLHFAQSNQH